METGPYFPKPGVSNPAPGELQITAPTPIKQTWTSKSSCSGITGMCVGTEVCRTVTVSSPGAVLR